MRTRFTEEQLADPDMSSSNQEVRKCTHCGFCIATCPTYLETGNELESPRGRIVLMKEMLEKGGEPVQDTIDHVDHCLSCLACVTTCPSGVNYRHLVDHARVYIEQHHKRPFPERMLRLILATILPRRELFRVAVLFGRIGRPFRKLLPGRLKGMVEMAPDKIPEPGFIRDRTTYYAKEQPAKGRVVLQLGCVQPVLRPSIDEATIRLLNRHGVDVTVVGGSGCCGAIDFHMGREEPALDHARKNVEMWEKELDSGATAIVITASGCGSEIKEYGFMLRKDPEWAERAARVAAASKDLAEVLADLPPLTTVVQKGLPVAYHNPCSLQHGQQIRSEPLQILKRAGFDVKQIPEGHICCGSAGTYSILQPDMSKRLRMRKIGNIRRTKAPVVATSNIGCIGHLEGGGMAMVHVAELLDWATGGPRPIGVPDSWLDKDAGAASGVQHGKKAAAHAA